MRVYPPPSRLWQASRSLSGAILWALILSAILQFIYSLPHAIALRKVLLLACLALVFKHFMRAWKAHSWALRPVFAPFVLLQAWLLVIAGLVAAQPLESFREWQGQWLPPLIAFIVGVGLVQALAEAVPERLKAIVLWVILVPITTYLCINDVIVFVHAWVLGNRSAAGFGGMGDHHGISGYLVALLLPLVVVDLLSRYLARDALVPIRLWAVWGLLILLLGTLVLSMNRSGLVSAAATLVLCVLLVLRELRLRYAAGQILLAGISVLVIAFCVALFAYKTDPRWHQFIETIPVAWDIDRDLRWLNADDPATAPVADNGRQVDISEYSRIAWAHEGWRMLVAHPWGTEISRSVFRRLEIEKHGHAAMSHTHNSWIDLGLQAGVIGMVLWGFALFLLARHGWRAWRSGKDPVGLALAVLVMMFVVRGLMDSIFRDHELEQFFLVAAMLFWAVVVRAQHGVIRRGS